MGETSLEIGWPLIRSPGSHRRLQVLIADDRVIDSITVLRTNVALTELDRLRAVWNNDYLLKVLTSMPAGPNWWPTPSARRSRQPHAMSDPAPHVSQNRQHEIR